MYRFSRISPQHGWESNFEGRTSSCHCYCGKYLGEIGKSPVDRSLWFTEKGSVEQMRSALSRMCNSIEIEKRDNRKQILKVVVYQRDIDRRFIGLRKVLLELQERVRRANDLELEITTILHNESTDPCAIYSQLSTADFYLTTHG